MVQPEKTFRHGSCSASVFANTFKKNGKEIEVKRISVQKAFKDETGWKTTNSYDINDLPKLILVASKAYDYLTYREKDFE